MARAIKGRTKIWVRPFTTRLSSNCSNSEEADVCIDDDENVKDRNKSVDQAVTENVQNKDGETSQLFESDTGLKEEYKQLLVKAVAERLKRKMPEDEMWKEIKKETGYNHQIVWNEMREAIKKKIMRLLPANDLLENIPTEMQLSHSDWLLFDHILVHEQINVINTDSLGNAQSNKEEPQCLQELFELVKQYDVENLVGETLMEAWTRLTSQYNSRGRQCSPMMLQLRWYQMKTLTRSCFYNTYAHNTNQDIHKTLESNVVVNLTVLQIEIAVAYNTIITKNCPSWETLITEKRVILSEEFSATKPLHNENKPNFDQAPESSNEPMIFIKLDENQMEDFDKIKNSEGSNTVTDDTIVIDLNHDKEYITALQKLMDKTTDVGETTPQVEFNNLEESEDFKLQLVREMAKMKLTRFIWKKLNKKMLVNRNYKKIWYQMRNTTIKKVIKLLKANDIISENMMPTMRLSEAEWLLFDLVLVHEKIICVNKDLLETKCLRDLFKLVVEYDVENLIGEKLAEAWINLTLKYNSGGRQCSPMLLQLRWHQLKELTRQQAYNPLMHPYETQSKLLISIATKYQKIILKDLSIWCTLIKEKRVILPEDFVKILKQNDKWKEVEAREGWYLHVKKVVSKPETKISTADYMDNTVCIEPDVSPSDTENKFDKIVEKLQIAPNNQLTKNKLNETKKNEIIDLDSDDEINEILLEKTDKTSNITQEKEKNMMNTLKNHLESNVAAKNIIGDKSKNQVDVDLAMHKPVNKPVICNDEPILCDSDDEIDKLLQEKANLMSIELPENLKILNKKIDEEIDEFKNMSTKIYEMEVEEFGIIKNETTTAEIDEELDETDFDENNIEFADDGIKFEEGSDYTTKVKSTTVTSRVTDDEIDLDDEIDAGDENDTDERSDNPEIDQKLLMYTKVCTKKIDCMEVFKFIDYDSLRDKRLIEHVETQSKPVSKRARKNEDINSRQQAISGYDHDSVSSEDDVEIHKSFEKKLVNGKMYLKRSNFQITRATEIENSKNHNVTIDPPSIPNMLTEDQNMKLAKHVRDLIAAITSDSQDECDSMTNEITKIPVRSKVIKLPDKDQIRLLNQSLLTAEITPTHQPLLNLSTVNTTNSNDNEPSTIICSLGESPNKRLKTELETSGTWSSNKPIYCCWAREKIVRTEENSELDCSKHMCVDKCCTCCCRVDLVIMINTKRLHHQTTITPSPNISGVNNNNLQSNGRINNHTSSNTNVSGFPKCVDAVVNTNNTQNGSIKGNASSKTKINRGEIGNTITVLGNLESKGDNSSNKIPKNTTKALNCTLEKSTMNNTINSMIIRKDQKFTKTKVNNPVVKPSTSQEHRISVKTVPSFTKILPRLPIKSPQKSGVPVIGPKNSGLPLICPKKSGLPIKSPQKTGLSVKGPKDSGLLVLGPNNSELPDEDPQKSLPTYLILPPGVNLVQLGDQVALAINPGIELGPAELQSLITLCETMNNSPQQLNNDPSQIPTLLSTNC